MDLMEQNEEAAMLSASGHTILKSQKLLSMSLKEYLEVIEEKFVRGVEQKGIATLELEYTETFIKLVEEEKKVFLERTLTDLA